MNIQRRVADPDLELFWSDPDFYTAQLEFVFGFPNPQNPEHPQNTAEGTNGTVDTPIFPSLSYMEWPAVAVCIKL